MKKTILSIAVISAAIFAASCQKENLRENTASEGSASVFTATIETGANTKTTVERIAGSPATYKTKWESTDQISIDGSIYTATPDDTDKTKATFNKTSGADPTAPFHAYFPASMYSDSKATLPETYDYEDGKYNMPMYAQSSTTSLPFKNLCGVLAITVSGTDFASVEKIEVSSDKQMNGEFTATAEGVLTFASASLTDALKKVTLTFNTAKTIASDGSATFYTPVPPATNHTLTIKVTGGSTTAIMVTKKSGGVAVDRNTVYPIAFKPTTGTAKATIDGEQVDVNWVQLWAGGPKFAEYNVGASSATDRGHSMEFTDAAETGSNYVWGANWCTPSYDQMNELLLAAQGNSGSKVTCEYTTGDDIWGFKFTGKETGYTSNSVFFPAEDGRSDAGAASYWSATDNGSEAWRMNLHYEASVDDWFSNWDSRNPYFSGFVRPVLKN